MFAVLVCFLSALAASIVATRLVLAWLRHRQILDHPNERSSHSRPTPRGGGLAVTPVVLLAWAAIAAMGGGLTGQWPVIAAAAGLLALSWLDDKAGLPAKLRLGLHVVAVGIGLATMPADQLIFQGWLPLWADRLIGLGLWVWFVNLYNFMDGIDGITGVETACLALGLVLLQDRAAPMAAVIGGAGLGFLVWNWHPAKIFLGDSGSVPLGYVLGWLLLSAAGQGHWAAALILPAYYLADATLTLAKRAYRGENLLQAHRQHFYQQAVRGRASHAFVAGVILGANLLLIAAAQAAEQQPGIGLAAAVVAVGGLLAYLARLGRGAAP